ncbi:MAG: glycerol-3-phosphate dehydrogenase/oxidase [Acidimicrobiaceae bacterium]|nr:glycerol-3-phosphate dehydrogenase/oxidase [Acidimicrobiaceae bacterium]
MTSFNRDESLALLTTSKFDVVVIGAGITGAGVALDAASRGLKVALIDAGDIASGTSSKSSKMVHGGLRYLQQREFRLVYENLRERQRLLENAPFLVRPLPFLIPLFGSNGVASRTLVKGYSTALRLYDLTGGWRIGQRHRKISKAESLSHLPTLRAESLVAGFLYLDARGDDARVALALAKTAALDYRASVANYVRALDIVRDNQHRASGVVCRNELDHSTFTIQTSTIINATGVWADEIFAMAEHVPSHRISPAKGVHLSVPRTRLPADVAAVFSVPNEHRSIFIIPAEDAPVTFIGTTDTAYDGVLDDPSCTPADVKYLLDAANASTLSNLTVEDVTGLWAGLRPLLAPSEGRRVSQRTADLSRRHRVTDSLDGVVHITGGKWTTYRQMAQDTVDALSRYVPSLPKVRTKNLRLHGTSPWRPQSEIETHLYQRFGSDSAHVLALINARPELAEIAIKGQNYINAEFVYCARTEMVTSLVDLLTRRTRAHLMDARATLSSAPAIVRLVADDLKWDDEECNRQLASYRDLVIHELECAGLVL